MPPKSTTTIGIEFDNFAIRAAEVMATPKGKGTEYTLQRLEEIAGAFAKDDALIDGLASMRERLAPGAGDRIVSCVNGKQIYAAQIPFRRLPEEEMRNALKYEIRKNLPFEVSGSTIEFQILETGEKKSDTPDVLVTAAANLLLDRHVRCLEKADLKPDAVDIMPLAVINAFWAYRHDGDTPAVNVVLHIGPEISTLVIDGENATLYHRTIYFAAHELYGGHAEAGAMAQRERERRLLGITDEITRSLSFYESNFHSASFSVINVMGSYLEPELLLSLHGKTGLQIEAVNLAKAFGSPKEEAAGKFDVAIALAMRNAE